MKRELVEDDAEAKAIADYYDVSQSMVAEANAKLPNAIAAEVGVAISAKRGMMNSKGLFEFVFITYMDGFKAGENGWTVFRWSDVEWEELPFVCEQLVELEKTLLPQALGRDNAEAKVAKVEAARKEN